MIQVKEVQLLGFIVNQVKISNILVNLGTNASFDVTVFDITGAPILSKSLSLTPDEYNKWGDDDDYINDLAIQKLGLEKV